MIERRDWKAESNNFTFIRFAYKAYEDFFLCPLNTWNLETVVTDFGECTRKSKSISLQLMKCCCWKAKFSLCSRDCVHNLSIHKNNPLYRRWIRYKLLSFKDWVMQLSLGGNSIIEILCLQSKLLNFENSFGWIFFSSHCHE